MRRNTKIILSVLFVAIFSQSALAKTDVGLVGNFALMNASVSPAPPNPNSAQLGIGGGIYGQFSLMPELTLDLGLIYAGRKNGRTVASIDSSNSFKYLEIPVVARYWIIPMLNVGAGLYYAMGMGDISNTTA